MCFLVLKPLFGRLFLFVTSRIDTAGYVRGEKIMMTWHYHDHAHNLWHHYWLKKKKEIPWTKSAKPAPPPHPYCYLIWKKCFTHWWFHMGVLTTNTLKNEISCPWCDVSRIHTVRWWFPAWFDLSARRWWSRVWIKVSVATAERWISLKTANHVPEILHNVTCNHFLTVVKAITAHVCWFTVRMITNTTNVFIYYILSFVTCIIKRITLTPGWI